MTKPRGNQDKAAAASHRVAIVPKNASETIRVSLDTYQGHRVFSVRVFFKDEHGKSRPGKGGLSFRVDKLEKFAEAVTSALMAARASGYIKR